MSKARDIADSASIINYLDGLTTGLADSPTFTGTVTAAALAVDTDVLLVDDTNNRVGINVASPAYELDIDGNIKVSQGLIFGDSTGYLYEGATDQINFRIGADGPYVTFKDVGSSVAEFGNASGALALKTGASERMRIDSAGSVYIGSTTDSGTGYHRLSADGFVRHKRAGDVVAVFDRGTSDGDIVLFRKDGETVGNIGVGSVPSTDKCLTIGKSDSGILFDNVGNRISPWDMNTNAVLDNYTDLGYSGGRFKNLYLSGGVYLGGTTSANLLDDYEEGTFTATYYGDTSAGTTTYTAQAGFYTKIGNRVSFQLQIGVSSATGTGAIRIGGLPFTLSSATSSSPVFSVASSGFTFSGQLAAGGIRATATLTLLGLASDAGETQIEVDSSVSYLRVSGVYFVD